MAEYGWCSCPVHEGSYYHLESQSPQRSAQVRWFNFGVGEQEQKDGGVSLVKHPDQVSFAKSPPKIRLCL
jgi:hypothetical protein